MRLILDKRISYILLSLFTLFYIYWICSVQPFPEPDAEWIFLRPNLLASWIMQNTNWTLDDLKLVLNSDYPSGLLWPSILFHIIFQTNHFLEYPWLINILTFFLLIPVIYLFSDNVQQVNIFTLFILSSPLTALILTDYHPHNLCVILFLLGSGFSRHKKYGLGFLAMFFACISKQLGSIYVFGYLISSLIQLATNKRSPIPKIFISLSALIFSRFFYLNSESNYLSETFQRYTQFSPENIASLMIVIFYFCLSIIIIISLKSQNPWIEKTVIVVAFLMSYLTLIFSDTVMPGTINLEEVMIGGVVWSLLLSYLSRSLNNASNIDIWLYGWVSLSIYLLMASKNHNPYIQIWFLQILLLISVLKSMKGQLIYLFIGLSQLLFMTMIYTGIIHFESLTSVHSAFRNGPYQMLGKFSQDLRWNNRKIVQNELSNLHLDADKTYYFLALPEINSVRYLFRDPTLEIDQQNLHPIKSDTNPRIQNQLKIDLQTLGFDPFFQKIISQKSIAALLTRCSMNSNVSGFSWFEDSDYFEEDILNFFKGILIYRMQREGLRDAYKEVRLMMPNQDYCLYVHTSLRAKKTIHDKHSFWNKWKTKMISRDTKDQSQDPKTEIKSALVQDASLSQWHDRFRKDLAQQSLIYQALESTDFNTIRPEDCHWFNKQWKKFPYHEPFLKFLNSKCEVK